jgi:hypothetical protein
MMLTIPDILAFYADGRKPPTSVAVPLDQLKALFDERNRLYDALQATLEHHNTTTIDWPGALAADELTNFPHRPMRIQPIIDPNITFKGFTP